VRKNLTLEKKANEITSHDIKLELDVRCQKLIEKKLHAAFPDAEIIIFGHSHRPLLELVDKTVTVMNPGGAGAPRFGIRPSVGILELEAGIPPRGRIVPLG
jgi:predicted phosphodiesterase